MISHPPGGAMANGTALRKVHLIPHYVRRVSHAANRFQTQHANKSLSLKSFGIISISLNFSRLSESKYCGLLNVVRRLTVVARRARPRSHGSEIQERRQTFIVFTLIHHNAHY